MPHGLLAIAFLGQLYIAIPPFLSHNSQEFWDRSDALKLVGIHGSILLALALMTLGEESVGRTVAMLAVAPTAFLSFGGFAIWRRARKGRRETPAWTLVGRILYVLVSLDTVAAMAIGATSR